MNFAWLRLPLVTTLCLLPALASAGGGGSTTSPPGGSTGFPGDTGVVTTFPTSDTGDTDSGDTGGTSGTDTGDTDSGEGSSSSGEVCGECTDSEETVQIVSPADGAVVGTLFEVRVTAPYTCVCDTCGCYEMDPASVNLRINGSTYENCNGDGCTTTDHTFTVMLGPGEYTIDALAPHNLTPVTSAPITVTVEGEVATGSTGDPPPPPPPPPPAGSTGPSADSSGTSAGANDDGGSSGCGCTTSPTPGGALGGLLALVGLLGLRRRRQ